MAGAIRSIRESLSWGCGVLGGGDTAYLEAEILLSKVIARSREFMLAHGEEPLTESAYGEFASMVDKRSSTGVPVAYLVGHREFNGLDFIVRVGVLVPRPETETLVGEVQVWVAENGAQFSGAALVDAGCGSGIIAVALAKTTGRQVLATDISPVALEVARENAVLHGVIDRVVLLRGSWLEPVRSGSALPPIFVVVSNPPYIPTPVIASLARDVRDFEPSEALDGGTDGLDSIREVAVQAYDLLLPQGLLAMEIGDDQAAAVEALLMGQGWTGIRTIKDMAGLSRVILAQKAHK